MGTAAIFVLLVVVYVASDVAFLVRHRTELRAGALSLGSPGMEGEGPDVKVIEANILYLPGFREVYDGRLWSGDDYLFESKGAWTPTPLLPKLLGGALLRLAAGDLDRCIVLIHAAGVVTAAGVFVVLRVAGMSSPAALAVVAATSVLPLLLPFPALTSNLLGRVLSLPEVGRSLAISRGRFIAPLLTAPFFLAFLLVLFRDPRLRGPRSPALVGGLAALQFYVYYGNFFVAAPFILSYLAVLAVAFPEDRRRHLAAVAWFAILSAPFLALSVVGARSLSGDYFLRVGMSRLGSGGHPAVSSPLLLTKYFVVYSLFPILATALVFRRDAVATAASAPASRGPLLRRYLLSVDGTRGLPLVQMAAMSFVATVVPGVLQDLVDLPQPSRIHQRLGTLLNVVTLGMLVWYVGAAVARGWRVSRSPWPVARAVGRFALWAVVVLALLHVLHVQIRQGWDEDPARYRLEPAHTSVVAAIRDAPMPCVVSSSSRIASLVVTSRSHCDSLTPHILLSAVSTAEAVDRYVAAWVLEDRPLTELLAMFRLRTVAPGDVFRAACVGGGAGEDAVHYYTDGISMTHHHAPCRPAELRSSILRTFEAYTRDPAAILRRYRVDYVYSPGGALHPAIAASFRPTDLPGLFRYTGERRSDGRWSDPDLLLAGGWSVGRTGR